MLSTLTDGFEALFAATQLRIGHTEQPSCCRARSRDFRVRHRAAAANEAIDEGRDLRSKLQGFQQRKLFFAFGHRAHLLLSGFLSAVASAHRRTLHLGYQTRRVRKVYLQQY